MCNLCMFLDDKQYTYTKDTLFMLRDKLLGISKYLSKYDFFKVLSRISLLSKNIYAPRLLLNFSW